MATVSLDAVKAYARVDGDEEDALLESLTNAAEEYLSNAGIDPGLSAPALYQLAVCGIVLHWYEQRNIATGAAPTDVRRCPAHASERWRTGQTDYHCP